MSRFRRRARAENPAGQVASWPAEPRHREQRFQCDLERYAAGPEGKWAACRTSGLPLRPFRRRWVGIISLAAVRGGMPSPRVISLRRGCIRRKRTRTSGPGAIGPATSVDAGPPNLCGAAAERLRRPAGRPKSTRVDLARRPRAGSGSQHRIGPNMLSERNVPATSALLLLRSRFHERRAALIARMRGIRESV